MCVCMRWSVKRFENPHFAPCCYGIYLNMGRTAAESDAVPKKYDSVINKPLCLCVTETRRLQTLDTTGGNVSIVFYHRVSTKG